jgi:hypothetical protein
MFWILIRTGGEKEVRRDDGFLRCSFGLMTALSIRVGLHWSSRQWLDLSRRVGCHGFMFSITQLWRKLFRVIGLTAAIGGLLAVIAGWLYWEGVKQLTNHYLTDFYREQQEKAVIRFGKNLPEVDEVRLTLLHEEPSASFNETYKAPAPSGQMYHVINRRTVAGDQAREIATLWRQLNWGESAGAACFEPHHVIEFRHQGRIICESAVCFQCGYVTLPVFWGSPLIGVVFGEFQDRKNPIPYPLEAVLNAHLGKYVPKPRQNRPEQELKVSR